MSGAVWSSLTFAGYFASTIAALVMASWLYARRARLAEASGACAAAFTITAGWSLARPVLGPGTVWDDLLLGASYLAWLWALYRMFAQDGRHASVGPIRPVVAALGFVGLLLVAIALAAAGERTTAGIDEILRLGAALRLLFCAGALVLVHNLYAGAAGPARAVLRWPAAALGGMWFYDLNLNTVTYLAGGAPAVLAALRGAVPLVMAGLFALGTMSRERQQPFRPSRAFAFQSLSLFLIGTYFVLMVVAFQGIAAAGGDFLGLVQIAFLAAASALALVLLPSKRLRGWLWVWMAKHLFAHRYDYREEWQRFTRTMGRAGPEAPSLPRRVIQAVADVTDSPAGLLLTPAEHGGLALEADWHWPDAEIPARAMEPQAAHFFAQSQFIVDLDHWRAGKEERVPSTAVPQWIADDQRAWAMVPLLHYERLLGVVVLARPAFVRTLDWEDFDLLRVIGRQLASYLAEQASQDALGEAQRFDEFNRRIAFVMHDIKNLASQLALLARNAEKHADNPAFRADMLVTLKNSSEKLNTLLARLGRYGQQPGEATTPVQVRPLLRAISERYAAQHPVVSLDGPPLIVEAQPEALEQALMHLVQNSVEASPGGETVVLDARGDALDVVIEVMDSGTGMTPEFVRSQLFKPFQSSKPGGFGIGAYEARATIQAMGGSLDVESREGLGTRFVVRLPRAGAKLPGAAQDEEKAKVA